MKKQLQRIVAFYHDSFSHYLFITAVAFAGLLFISLVVGIINKGLSADLMEWFAQQIAQIGVMDDEGNFSAIALFFNNARAMTLAILFGFLPYIYLSALNLGANTMLIGFLAAVYLNAGQPLLVYLCGILPHGIFEIPAMIVSVSCGIYLCAIVTDNCRQRTEGAVKSAIRNILSVYFYIILPLLVLAAVVEAYLTPVILQAIL